LAELQAAASNTSKRRMGKRCKERVTLGYLAEVWLKDVSPRLGGQRCRHSPMVLSRFVMVRALEQNVIAATRTRTPPMDGRGFKRAAMGSAGSARRSRRPA